MDATSLLIAQEPEPELPIGPLLVSFGFVLVSAVWIYIDARSIGARKGLVGGIANNSPLVWAIGTVLMWIVVVPVYLYNRGKIQHAAAVVDRRYVPQVPGSATTTDWQHVGWAEAAQAALEHQPPARFEAGTHPSPDPVAPPAGWYLDPEHGGYQRWWDGTKWTEHLAPPDEPPGTGSA